MFWRSTFLALVVAALSKVGSHAAERSGLVLLGDFNYAGGHAASAQEAAWLLPRLAPRLDGLGSRASAEWVRNYLASPHLAQPGTTMPDMLHGRPAAERAAAAEALTHHLLSQATPKFYRTLPDRDASARGGEHEFNFGSNFDNDGAIWTLHGLTGSYTSDRPCRGWALRHFPDERREVMCSGLRSPGGIALNAAGDGFYVESQGPWASANMLKQLRPGGFMGHPIGNQWYDHAPNMGPRPAEPTGGQNGRRDLDAHRIPQLVLPSVEFPYKKMGQSASAVIPDGAVGKFGPFAGQFFVGDYTLSLVMRAEMEQVNGLDQGACDPFRRGFATGLIGGTLTKSGYIFVGGSKRGWPVRGLAPHALQRLDWTGKVSFAIQTMRVNPDGFELRFTAPVDAATARDPRSHTLETFTHHYFGAYGGPEIERADQRTVSATPSSDGLSVRLVVDKLVVGHIHELHLPGLRDRAGQPLVRDVSYYTLNQIPKS